MIVTLPTFFQIRGVTPEDVTLAAATEKERQPAVTHQPCTAYTVDVEFTKGDMAMRVALIEGRPLRVQVPAFSRVLEPPEEFTEAARVTPKGYTTPLLRVHVEPREHPGGAALISIV